MSQFDKKIAAVALRQHSVISLVDVRRAGGGLHHAKARAAAGRWIRVYEGVYRLAGAPWTYEGQVFAAVCAAGPGAVASHLCAARLLGLGFRRADVEISVPRGRLPRLAGVRVHTSTDLGRCQTVRRAGIPVTDPARTLLDLARYVRPVALMRTVEVARRLGIVDWHDLFVCVARHARKGRHGIRRLRSLIAVGVANDQVTDTDSELAALALLREHGFGEPVLGHRIYDDEGQVQAEMDLAYVAERVDFEINGSVHLDPLVAEKDAARDAYLQGLGWTVRRVWWEIPVRQPDKFVRIVRATFRLAAQKEPSCDVPGRSSALSVTRRE